MNLGNSLPWPASKSAMNTQHVIVLGGGFGGLHTAMHLERLLGSRTDVEITLVSKDNFFLFTPMLHEVAASDLDITHIVSPIRTLLKRTRVVIGEVTELDLHLKHVTVTHGFTRHSHDMAFDHVVIAFGATTNFYGLPGLELRALTMKTLGDAIELRNRVIATMEEADTECADQTDGLLTFVVAGGGFAGVETMAGLNDFVRDGLRYYPRLRADRVRMVLIHSGDVILPELGEKLGAYAQAKLAHRGVEIITGRRVAGMTESDVVLDDGRRIPSKFVVWTAGTSPQPLLHTLPCVLDHGRVVVEETLAVPGFSGVWSLGDCAVVPNRKTGRAHPPTAQHALRQARTAARNIVASIAAQPLQPFTFTTIGQLAAIGKRSGVARVFGMNFSGFFAWWLWRTIYLSKLPRFEKKMRVAIDWSLDLVFPRDFVQFLTVREPSVSALHTDAVTSDPRAIPAPTHTALEVSSS